MNQSLSNVAVVILAAGRGTRLGCIDKPKVMLELGGKPMVAHTVETLQKLGFGKDQICLVVGFQKEKVKEHFGDVVTYADQDQQLGTAHAAYTGMCALPSHIKQVLVMGGDDSAFYTPETLRKFIEEHLNNDMHLTLLSSEMLEPRHLGRVVRNPDGHIEVVEKENLTEEQKLLTEISTGTFMFNRMWFQDMFPTMPKIEKLGEYGLPTTMTMVRNAGLPHQVVKLENSEEWFGVNTPEELEEARKRKESL
jgi:UDP-N-acetylglucosamine pyrophosphorylase